METGSVHLDNATQAFRDLADAAQYYLDMLYACDPDMVSNIFHEHATLCTLDNGQLIFRTVNEYKDVLRERVSPKSKGAAREDELITLDFSTPTQGLIKIKMRINQMVFIDYLTMIKLPEGWRIVSKTYQRLS